MPAAAEEASARREGRKASASTDAASGDLRETRTDGTAAAHEAGKGAGISEVATGEMNSALHPGVCELQPVSC